MEGTDKSMSRLLASFGATAARRLQPMMSEKETWLQWSKGAAAFAYRSAAEAANSDQGGLFRTPDDECAGVLAGKVFGLEAMLRTLPPDLPREHRLGLFLHDLYRRHGNDFPRDLDGCFVLVMAVGQRLVAARDAIGQRTLYLLDGPDAILIADCMSPLMVHPDCRRGLHPGAVVDYLSTGFCPFQRTPVKGIAKIPPGTTWSFDNGRSREHRFRIQRGLHHSGNPGALGPSTVWRRNPATGFPPGHDGDGRLSAGREYAGLRFGRTGI